MPEPDRSTLQWREKLSAARTQRQVLAVVRDFLASITQEEWASLDLEPDAANLESADELAHLSYEVVRKSHSNDHRSAEMLVAVMTAVLSDALARIASLANPRNARSA